MKETGMLGVCISSKKKKNNSFVIYRSTSSSGSRHSTSLSSHSSDSGSNNFAHCHRHHHQQSSLTEFFSHTNKLHILSPISDKSSQEPASETLENNRNNNSQKGSPEDGAIEAVKINSKINSNTNVTTPTESSSKKRRAPQNKNLINLALQSSSSADTEIQGSDSGISIGNYKYLSFFTSFYSVSLS